MTRKQFAYLSALLSLICASASNLELMAAPKEENYKSRPVATNFVNALRTGLYPQAEILLDSKMKQVLPAGKLQQTWQSIIAQFGQFRSILDTRTEKMPASYERTLFHCQFEKASRDLQVVVDPQGAVCGFFVKQHTVAIPEPSYADQKKFSEIPIKVGKGQLALDGTLTLPSGSGPFPALVLVHGSGSHDRDETILGTKVFRDLAWGLASRGIAVLRYNKRNFQYPQQLLKNLDRLTVKDETIEDALAAIQTLQESEKVNKSSIYLLGHSLGGFVIPRLNGINSKIAGYIIMAGSNRPLEDMVLEQTQYVLALKEGQNLSAESKNMLGALAASVQKVKDPNLSAAIAATELPLGIPAAYWLDLRSYNPLAEAKSIKQPVLVLQGESDYQVTMKDFENWKNALAGNSKAEFISYPKLGHSFTPMSAKPGPQDYEKPDNVSKQLVEDIAAWIKKSSKK